MKCHKLLCTLVISLCVLRPFAQPICGFDQVHGKKMQEDASYRQRILNYENNLRNYIQQQQENSKTTTNSNGSHFHVLGGPPYIIPVVVHVIHTGGTVGSIYNPTDVQIQGAIDYLNQVYNGTYPGTQGVGDLQIQFVLAKRDPNCNPTNGINRVDGSGITGYVSAGVNASTTLGTDDINVKNLIRWDPTQYYNIWVVDKIDGNDGTSGSFIAGFAYFPGGSPSYDGTVMLATQMITGQKTLPHEIGHAFNLYHTFQGSSGTTCPTNANCNTDGDQVCDTDPETQPAAFACRTGINSCTGTAYNISTESNYMNYTNCYTLFTAGQKTRMLASAASPDRISLSNSLGGTAPNAGTVTCAPKINFEYSSDLLTEFTAATTGCRSYKDYTYNLLIGNGPSQTATATLTVTGGNAVEGLDFDITTNGNFNAPSKSVIFPLGSITPQPFTIRIYDDAEVESAENFTLGFTVNNGGGNAVAGTGKPTITISIADNDINPSGPQNLTKYIGSSIGTAQSPFAGANAKYKSQFIYKVSELTAVGISAGNIVGLGLNILKSTGAAFVYNGLTIKMGQTSQNTMYTSGTDFPLNDAGFTTVYSSAYSTVNGWNNFTFTTPFTWNGTSNVVIEICYDNGATTSVNDNCQLYSDGVTTSNYIFSNINCGTAFGGFSYFSSGYKPVINFVYANQGTQIQTTLNASKQEYLGPNSDIYFYDQVNNKLMARIQNLSSFDYGCTQVIIDRAGTGTSQFWNSNPANYFMDKTFHVIPTTNNPSGNYNITLFYTQSEIAGWQAATGQTLSGIQLAKVSTLLSNVTPANPSGGGTVSIVSPGISSLGTNTGLTYSFSTGFSGFGAGVTGTIALPLQLISFTGKLTDQFITLDWTAQHEINNGSYDIERSYDGISFNKIGNMPAIIGNNLLQSYSFSDPDLPHGNNYYRLRQNSPGNGTVFSQIVLIHDPSADQAFKVLNNPFYTRIDIQLGETTESRTDISLYDVTGRELYHSANANTGINKISIDLSQKLISAGVYLLQVKFNNETHVARVIKQ